jgi:hypothetical protein
MKRILVIALCAVLVFSFSSCVDRDKACEECEEEYLSGMSDGHATVFMELYNSVPNKKLLYRDSTWNEKDFSFVISHTQEICDDFEVVTTETIVSTSLYLPNSTLQQAFDEKNIYIGIYGLKKGSDKTDIIAWRTWAEICDDFDTYVLYSMSEADSNYIACDYFSTYDEISSISVVIVINGKIYAADYPIKN